jgi:hypothetical protein
VTEFDINEAARELASQRELNYVFAVGVLEMTNRLAGNVRAENIAREIAVAEVSRLDPRGQWAVENGDEPPAKRKRIPVNYGDN